MDLQILATLPMWLVAFLFSTTCHEAAHSLAAKLGGDDTALKSGTVTLDPIPHIKRSPFGMLIVPILTYLLNDGMMIGWASAPYDPYWAQRHPKRAALMSAAGPAANFAIVLVTAAAIHIGMATGHFTPPDAAHFAHVVVDANGNPYLIRQFPSVGTYLTTYGVGDALEYAAAQAVLGRAPITGKSPVSLPGFFARGDGLTR